MKSEYDYQIVFETNFFPYRRYLGIQKQKQSVRFVSTQIPIYIKAYQYIIHSFADSTCDEDKKNHVKFCVFRETEVLNKRIIKRH